MNRVMFLAVSVAVILATSSASTLGQTPQRRQYRSRQRYQPSRPVMSPYMDYFRQDSGLVDPYNYFVQRGSRLRQTFDQQQRQIDRQGQVGQGFQQLSVDEYLRRFVPTRAAPTGKGASFQTHVGFYGTR